ncbi:MAG TPA: hypothetical protein VN950_18555 [Terriglobales bacterium]|nr:hypothetical protein [Terriglobales bacterium]
MRWNKKASVTAFLAALVVAAVLNIYFIRNDGSGDLLWNADEAYLFTGVTRRGLHTSYLAYPWVLFAEFFYAPPPPDDQSVSVTVIRVTQSTVERHLVNVADPSPGTTPGEYTPFEGRIYANCPKLGGLCKWTGEGFEAATTDEQRGFGGIEHLKVLEIDNVNGWSKRGMPGNGNQFIADIGGKFSLLVRNEAGDARQYSRISIYLQRPGRVPERIWYLDGTPQWVTRSAYEHAFQRP